MGVPRWYQSQDQAVGNQAVEDQAVEGQAVDGQAVEGQAVDGQAVGPLLRQSRAQGGPGGTGDSGNSGSIGSAGSTGSSQGSQVQGQPKFLINVLFPQYMAGKCCACHAPVLSRAHTGKARSFPHIFHILIHCSYVVALFMPPCHKSFNRS